jgi:hypothetical protein
MTHEMQVVLDAILERVTDMNVRLRRMEETQTMPQTAVPDFTVETLAEHLSMSQSRLCELLKKDLFPGAYKHGRCWRIPPDTVEAYKESQASSSAYSKPSKTRRTPRRKTKAKGHSWEWLDN